MLRSTRASRRRVRPAQGAGSMDGDLAVLIEEHLPLVKHVVFQVAVNFPRHVDRDELARAGALGLVEAARRYDEERGVPFEGFAAQRIRGAILDAVRAADWAPRSVRNLARQLENVEQNLATELGRVPNKAEVGEALDMSQSELSRLQTRMFRSIVLALDHETTDEVEKSLTLVDVLVDEHSVEPSCELETRELHGYLRDAIALLPERHRIVIIGYFLEGRTSLDLADFLGVTESRISQLRSESLLMLQEGIEAQYLSETPVPGDVTGRVARRKASYAQDIGEASNFADRMEQINLIESDAPVLSGFAY
ncbi:MAG: FliA/WhiG family RNA polymerase sigma factor [Acidimicrobiaceae bacterium]|nr:FliA/WhiG family RNA polymerase sigma factor [Acidimicrobiaceae bacterium]